jgi:hypothetical protein
MLSKMISKYFTARVRVNKKLLQQKDHMQNSMFSEREFQKKIKNSGPVEAEKQRRNFYGKQSTLY